MTPVYEEVNVDPILLSLVRAKPSYYMFHFSTHHLSLFLVDLH